MIVEQPLMSLVYKTWVDGIEVTGAASDPAREICVSLIECEKSIVQPSGFLRLTLTQQSGDELAQLGLALDAVINDPAAEPTPIEFGMNYRSMAEGGFYVPFVGHAHSVRFGPKGQFIEIEAVDDKLLHITRQTQAVVGANPRDAVDALTAELGIVDTLTDLPTKAISHQVGQASTGFEILNAIRESAGIPYSWHFNQAGMFVWAPWDEATFADASGVVYVYEERKNIVRLEPVSADMLQEEPGSDGSTQKTGGPSIDAHYANHPQGAPFELHVVPQPWMWPGAVIKVIQQSVIPGLPVGENRMRIDTLIHRIGSGESRSIMQLRRII